MAEGNSDSMEGKLCSAGNEGLPLPGGSAAHHRVDQDRVSAGGAGRAQSSLQPQQCWTRVRGRDRQLEDAGLKSPQSTREAVSAPWKQVWLCGKCFLVISLPWHFVLRACLHTDWHLLPWLIIHPDPVSPVWSQHWPVAPDVTADRGSDS